MTSPGSKRSLSPPNRAVRPAPHEQQVLDGLPQGAGATDTYIQNLQAQPAKVGRLGAFLAAGPRPPQQASAPVGDLGPQWDPPSRKQMKAWKKG